MNFLILILLLCLFISLYVLYLLSHDDFVILRRDAPMEKIFNSAFIFTISAILTSRLLYVLLNPSNLFHSLLGFLLFPYFPGLSIIGGIIGGFGISYIYLNSKNLPVGRIMDFFSMSFLVSYPIGIIGYLVLLGGKIYYSWYILLFLSAIVLLVFVRFILKAALGGKLKDGSLTLIFLASFSVIFISTDLLRSLGQKTFDPEEILGFILLIFSLITLVKYENLHKFILKNVRH